VCRLQIQRAGRGSERKRSTSRAVISAWPVSAGGEIWMVAGHYTVRLRLIDADWRIAGITLTVFYQEGNLEIPNIARSRASSSPPR
jgi:hypothetical protein